MAGSGSRRGHVLQKIDREPWFWGDIKKEDASRLLDDQEHGSFLVRKSSGRGGSCYTLVVKKNDLVRNVRIHQGHNGLFGIVQDKCVFAEVTDLIQHYRENPPLFHENFPHIDLLQPVCKPIAPQLALETASAVLHRLVGENREQQAMQHEYNVKLNRWKQLLQEEEQSRTTERSLTVVLSLFEEQLSLLNVTFGQGAGLMLPAGIADPRASGVCESVSMKQIELYKRIDTVKRRMRDEQVKKVDRKRELQTVREASDELKSLLESKRQELDPLMQQAQENGMDRQYLELLFEEEEEMDQNHHDRSNWWVECDRAEAERKLLADREPGTFLVRPNSNTHHKDREMSLSIVCNKDDGSTSIRHCVIYKDSTIAGGQYGFHPDFCIFASVDKLVKKHQTLNLKYYNKLLDVCLTYPVNYAPPVPDRRRANTDLGSFRYQQLDEAGNKRAS